MERIHYERQQNKILNYNKIKEKLHVQKYIYCSAVIDNYTQMCILQININIYILI